MHQNGGLRLPHVLFGDVPSVPSYCQQRIYYITLRDRRHSLPQKKCMANMTSKTTDLELETTHIFHLEGSQPAIDPEGLSLSTLKLLVFRRAAPPGGVRVGVGVPRSCRPRWGWRL